MKGTQITWIYLIKDVDSGYHKIGRSDNPAGRLNDLRKQATIQATPNNYELLEAWECEAATEKALHSRYHEKRVRGEWFDLSSDDIQAIKTNLDIYRRYINAEGSTDYAALWKEAQASEARAWGKATFFENTCKMLHERIDDLEARNRRLVDSLEKSNDVFRGVRAFADKNGYIAGPAPIDGHPVGRLGWLPRLSHRGSRH